MPYQSKSDEYQAQKAFGILHAQRMKRSGVGEQSMRVKEYTVPGEPVGEDEVGPHLVNHGDPVIQAVYGVKSPRRVWYAVERTSGSVEIFNTETARAKFIIECYEKGHGDTIAKQYEVDFEVKSSLKT